MEALAAVGLASNIVSFVEFGFKAARQCHEIMKTGSTPEFDSIDAAAQVLMAQCTDVKARLSQSQTPLSRRDEALERLAVDCLRSSTLLQDVLSSIRSSDRDSQPWNGMFKRPFRALTKRPKIEKLERQLNRSRTALDSAILHDFTSKYDLQAAISDGSFHTQDEKTKATTYALAAGPTTYENLVRAESHAIRQHITSETERALQQLASEQQVQRFVDSLKFPDMGTRFETVESAHERTFNWIFDPNEGTNPAWSSFPTWLISDSTFYWINGVAGAGKSTLMSYICNDERTSQLLHGWQVSGELVMPHFFFWRPGSALQHSCCGMLRSLAHQALSRFAAIRQHVATVYLPPSGQDFVPAWTETNLCKLVKLIFSQRNTPLRVCLFLDGADELEEGYDNLIDVIKDICKPRNIKACIASRPLPQFTEAFKDDPRLRLQDLTRNDLQQYVEGSLLPLAQKIDIDMSYIVAEILQNASGMFLWVKLVVQDIKIAILEGSSTQEVETRLRRMPQQLDNLYSHLLGQIDPTYHDEAFGYFILMLKSRDLELENFVMLYCFTILQAPDRDLEKLFSSPNSIAFWSRGLLLAVQNTPKRILTRTRGLLQPVNPDIFIELDTQARGDKSFSMKVFTTATAALTTQVHMIHRSFFDYLCALEETSEVFRKQKSQLDVFSLVMETQLVLNTVCGHRGFYNPDPKDDVERHVNTYAPRTLPVRVSDLAQLYESAHLAWTRHGVYNRALIRHMGRHMGGAFYRKRPFGEPHFNSFCGDWIERAARYGFNKPLEAELNSDLTVIDRRRLFRGVTIPIIPHDLARMRIAQRRGEMGLRYLSSVRYLVDSGIQVQTPFTNDEIGLRHEAGDVSNSECKLREVVRDEEKTTLKSPPEPGAPLILFKNTSAFAMFAARVWEVVLRLAPPMSSTIREAELTVNAFLQQGADPSAPVQLWLPALIEHFPVQKLIIVATTTVSQALAAVLTPALENPSSPKAVKDLLKENRYEPPIQFELYAYAYNAGSLFDRVPGGFSVRGHEVIQCTSRLSSTWSNVVGSLPEFLQDNLPLLGLPLTEGGISHPEFDSRLRKKIAPIRRDVLLESSLADRLTDDAVEPVLLFEIHYPYFA